MKWFQRHINWTLFISFLSLQIIGYVILWSLASFAPTWSFWLVFSILVILYFSIFDYALVIKGRKRKNSVMGLGWFILWLTGWIGVIVVLLIKIKKENLETNNGNQ